MSNHHCNDKNIAHCQSQNNFSFELSYTLFKLLIRIDNLHPMDIFLNLKHPLVKDKLR